MNTNTRTSRNWPYIITCAFVWTLLLGTLVMSSMDIIHTAHKLGLHGVKAMTAPGLVDALAIVGKLGRMDRFTDETRESAFKLMMFGGTLSLACNIYAGENLGERAYGVVLVVVFLLLEHYASRLNVAPAADDDVSAVDTAAITAAARTAARRAADAARKLAAKSPALRPAELARATGVSAGTAGRILKAARAVAPVSPGRPPIAPAATVAELAAIAA